MAKKIIVPGLDSVDLSPVNKVGEEKKVTPSLSAVDTVTTVKVGRPRKRKDANPALSKRPYIYVTEKFFRFLQKEKARRLLSGEVMTYCEILESLLNIK